MKIVKFEVNKDGQVVDFEVLIDSTDMGVSEIKIGDIVYLLDTRNLEDICEEVLSLIAEVRRKGRDK